MQYLLSKTVRGLSYIYTSFVSSNKHDSINFLVKSTLTTKNNPNQWNTLKTSINSPTSSNTHIWFFSPSSTSLFFFSLYFSYSSPSWSSIFLSNSPTPNNSINLHHLPPTSHICWLPTMCSMSNDGDQLYTYFLVQHAHCPVCNENTLTSVPFTVTDHFLSRAMDSLKSFVYHYR